MNLGFCRRTDRAIAIDYNSSAYKGFLQRNSPDDFAIEGTSIRIGATYFTGSSGSNWRTAESVYSDPTFAEVNADASGRGVLAGIEQACRTWPDELSAGGDGRVEIGLFPHEKSGDTFAYPLTWASCETRVFYLVPESGPAADAFAAAASFDYPPAARADAWAYDQADPWPWHIVSTAGWPTTSRTAACGRPARSQRPGEDRLPLREAAPAAATTTGRRRSASTGGCSPATAARR